MCGPKFCSMKITQEVREYAAAHGLSENQVLETGQQEKAREFRSTGKGIYGQ